MKRVLTAALLLGALAGCSTPVQPVKKSSPVGPPPPEMTVEGIVCPADVRQCPDGSFVSRNPANDCAFRRCPGVAPSQ